MPSQNKILVVAGEPSGDKHAADLIAELKKNNSQYHFFGIGGEQMVAQGVDLFFHINQLAVLGVMEVVRHLPFILKVFLHLKSWITKEKPVAVILVDYPGFNLRLAKMIKKLHIPVIYYICPQLWAWGRKRVKIIHRYVDLPLVIFKFEQEFYARYGISAKFVGHPLVDQIKIGISDAEFRAKHRLSPDKPIIALLPGSRLHEVSKLLPAMISASDQLKQKDEIEWVVGKSSTLSLQTYKDLLTGYPAIKILDREIHHLLKFARIAIVASGTATLETGFLGTPMIVLYKVSPLTYFIGKSVIDLKNIALANIILGEPVVPELIQHQATPKNIKSEIQKYLSDQNYYNEAALKLAKIPELIGRAGAANRAAREISKFLAGNRKTSTG